MTQEVLSELAPAAERKAIEAGTIDVRQASLDRYELRDRAAQHDPSLTLTPPTSPTTALRLMIEAVTCLAAL